MKKWATYGFRRIKDENGESKLDDFYFYVYANSKQEARRKIENYFSLEELHSIKDIIEIKNDG